MCSSLKPPGQKIFKVAFQATNLQPVKPKKGTSFLYLGPKALVLALNERLRRKSKPYSHLHFAVASNEGFPCKENPKSTPNFFPSGAGTGGDGQGDPF